jgi:hypothetical protein
MTPAEKRVKELIDRWLTSLDLHLGYVDLNDSAYNNVQPWPVHDRPTRWVLELAKQKALELQAAFESRLAMGDAKFAEAMELMTFLSTLVGIQHVQRYIPLADPQRHGQGTLTELDGLKPVRKPTQPAQATPASPTATQATVVVPPRTATPAPVGAPTAQTTAKAPATLDNDVTREMPRARAIPTPQKTAAANAPAKPVADVKSATAIVEALSDVHNLVINDAVRLLNWGRPWHELAELIARIADRPKLPEVRRILRSHRPAIEMRVADSKAEREEKESKG